MVQQAAQVKFTVLTTLLQAAMAVCFGIMVRYTRTLVGAETGDDFFLATTI